MLARRAALAILATSALAGCGAASSSAGGTASGAGVANRPALAPAGTSSDAGSSDAGSIVVGAPPSADIERSVTAAYTVPAGSFLGSFETITARAVGMGGYVVSSTTNPDNGGRIVSGSVTLKVPATRIADLLNGMPSSFVASSINFASIDHTADFVDVNARLSSAHSHLDALNSLLVKSVSLSDITTLEQQVESVQTEIDTDQGRLNVLTSSVTLASATIQLTERGASHAGPPGPLTGGLSSGWSNAVSLSGAILEGGVTALPLLVAALVGWLMWRRLRVIRVSRGGREG